MSKYGDCSKIGLGRKFISTDAEKKDLESFSMLTLRLLKEKE
jgi:hypothetical protein